MHVCQHGGDWERVHLLFRDHLRSSADAREAYAMGLVNRVVPVAELESAVKAVTDMICANAPLTIRAVKHTVGEILKDENERDLARANEMVEACFKSRDYTEGRTAFMEKRKPVFTGS